MPRVTRAVKTPVGQIITSDEPEDEEDVEEGALEPSSDNDIGPVDNANILHLGSDLPDPPNDFEEDPASSPLRQQRVPVANMGNEQSHELNANIRAAAEALQGNEKPRTSTGKLKRPSLNNPAYKNPVGNQRRLGGPSAPRPDVYDQLSSPEKRPKRKAPASQQQPNFSPLKKRRGAASVAERQAEADAVEDRQHEQTSPRASRRQRGLADELTEGQQIQANEAEAAAGTESRELHEDQLHYGTWFRQRDEPQQGNEALEALDNDSEQPKDAERQDAETSRHEDGEAGQTSAAGRKQRGRPLKKPADPSRERRGRPEKNDAGPTIQENDEAAVDSTKKRVGRPKKSDSRPMIQKNDDAADVAEEHETTADTAENADQQPQARTRPQTRAKDKLQPQTHPRPITESTRRLANLRQRRSGVAAEEGSATEDADVEEQPIQDANVNVSNQRATNGQPQRVVVRESELQLGRQSEPGAEESAAEQETADARIRKREASNQSARPNTGKKRQRVAQGNAPEQPHQNGERAPHEETEDVQEGLDRASSDDDSEAGEADAERLFGQLQILKIIVREARKVQRKIRDGGIKIKDDQVKTLVRLCKDASQRYEGPQGQSEQSEGQDSNSPPDVREIIARVRGLLGKNKDYPTDFTDKKKSTNIYSHLIPQLVSLIDSAASFDLALDEQEAAADVKISHLVQTSKLIKCVIDLAEAVSKRSGNYVQPTTDLISLCIKKPIHNGIAVPLRDVDATFSEEIHRHYLAVRAQKRAEQDAVHRALKAEQEERQNRQQALIDQWQKKWSTLHAERMAQEGGFPKLSKLQHLQIPSNVPYEHDRNGRLFSREEVFVPRVGPTPDLVATATRRPWSTPELQALQRGLEVHTGPKVLEKIIREHCRPGRLLNSYNVTEIVTTAALLRDGLLDQRKAEGAVVDQWILDIPIWTKAQSMPGQENEDVGLVGQGE